MSWLHGTRFSKLAPLRQAGVGGPGLAVGPALDRVRVANEMFELDDEAGSAFIIPVRVENYITPEASDPVQTVRDGKIVDLVAFHPRHPARWALRYGSAEWIGAVESQYLDS